MKKILIIDDEPDICLLLKKFFTKKGFSVSTSQNGSDGIQQLKETGADLVICDFKLPDYTGLEILQKIKILDPQTQVIIITGYSDVKIAVDALKKGAYDYVTKPLYPDEIMLLVKQALDAADKTITEANSTSGKDKNKPPRFVVGSSPQSQSVQKNIDLIAPTDMSVIISGETGTGKEYVAKAIHQKSKRSDQPFVALDCGALPEELAGSELFGHVKGAFTSAVSDKKGCFEMANGGTLFLDEIGNLSYENQIKLLRVLQEKVFKRVGGVKDIQVDVRIIVATNEDLKQSVLEKSFREDIYHRLNEYKIELAPLRNRVEDIIVFANYFLDEANLQLNKKVEGFDAESTKILNDYYWHGNLRELRNVVKRSVLLCQSTKINKLCLPDELSSPQSETGDDNALTLKGGMPKNLKSVVEEAEKLAIIEVLRRTNNNKTKTAKLLQIDRKTLYNKLEQYGIEH